MENAQKIGLHGYNNTLQSSQDKGKFKTAGAVLFFFTTKVVTTNMRCVGYGVRRRTETGDINFSYATLLAASCKRGNT